LRSPRMLRHRYCLCHAGGGGGSAPWRRCAPVGPEPFSGLTTRGLAPVLETKPTSMLLGFQDAIPLRDVPRPNNANRIRPRRLGVPIPIPSYLPTLLTVPYLPCCNIAVRLSVQAAAVKRIYDNHSSPQLAVWLSPLPQLQGVLTAGTSPPTVHSAAERPICKTLSP
jgi:hypothetical protein